MHLFPVRFPASGEPHHYSVPLPPMAFWQMPRESHRAHWSHWRSAESAEEVGQWSHHCPLQVQCLCVRSMCWFFVIDFRYHSSLCSDGIGRTGTFCAVFTVLERVKTEQVVDVFQTVKSMRTRRAGLLQTLVCSTNVIFVHITFIFPSIIVVFVITGPVWICPQGCVRVSEFFW